MGVMIKTLTLEERILALKEELFANQPAPDNFTLFAVGYFAGLADHTKYDGTSETYGSVEQVAKAARMFGAQNYLNT